MEASTLAELRAHLTEDAIVDAPFEVALERAWQVARDTWPGVDVAFAQFVPLLARELNRSSGTPLSAVLGRLHVSDLYLACACAAGDPAALRAIERHCGPAVRDVVRRVRPSPELCEQAAQAASEILFVRRGERPPKVERYSGRGDLRSFVMVVAAREAVRLCKTGGREQPADPRSLLDLAAEDGSDPELAYMRHAYRTHFEAALRDALAELPARDRMVLKYHYVDGLTGKRIAALYGVHPASVTRWLEGARVALLSLTRALLERRLGATAKEIESLERLVQSQLGLSLARHLGATGD